MTLDGIGSIKLAMMNDRAALAVTAESILNDAPLCCALVRDPNL